MDNKQAADTWLGFARDFLAPPVPQHAYGRSPQEDAQLRDMDAATLRKGLLGGLYGGLGAGALYYLAHALQNKSDATARVPSVSELASAPITEAAEPEPEEAPILPRSLLPRSGAVPAQPAGLKAAFDTNMLLFPAVGAGAGALIGHARGEKGKKNRNALLGATLGAAGGLGVGAATSKPVFEAISKGIPRTYQDVGRLLGLTSGDHAPAETGLHGGIRSVLGLTLPAAGAAGGLALADVAMREDSGKRNRDAVQAARKEYFNALTGREAAPVQQEDDEDDHEKTSSTLDGFLAGAFQAYQEKSAEPFDWSRLNPSHLWKTWVTDPWNNASHGAHALAIAGGLGSGAVGAKYMYDKTKEKSEARNRERARAARERMRGVTTPWIDPRELADVKALAAAGGPAARGV